MEGATQVTGSGHRIWDLMAVEQETAELLYALVAASKPTLVVESGTGHGYATEALAQALAWNGETGHGGRLVTYETDPKIRAAAEWRLVGFGFADCIEFRDGDSSDTELKPDLVFVDCAGSIREPVIRFWLTREWRPLVVVHDAKRPYPFELGEGVLIPGHDGVWIGRPKEN